MTTLHRRIHTRSPEETLLWGERLGKTLKGRECIILGGSLGSGKTVFVKGLAKGLGVKEYEYVSSASFVLLKVYQGRVPLYHFDLYRLKDFQELEGIGWDEYVGKGVVVMEWGDRFETSIPFDIKILIKFAPGEKERIMEWYFRKEINFKNFPSP